VDAPYLSAFRKGLVGLMGQEFNRANRPIYGDAEKAKVLSELNGLADSSIQSLKSQLAATGGLGGGGLAQGIADIEGNRLGQAAGFFRDLPIRENEARFARMNGLLGQALGWAGRDTPTIFSGQSMTGNRSGTSTRTGTQTAEGPSWAKGFLGNLGGALPGLGGGIMDFLKPKGSGGSGAGSWGY
jgi:hypothetical protein